MGPIDTIKEKEPDWRDMQPSEMFRRSQELNPSIRYVDVVDALRTIELSKEVSILFVGAAHGQEPASLLHVIRNIAIRKGKKFDTSVNLEIVDLRNPISKDEFQSTIPKVLVDNIFKGRKFRDITDGLIEMQSGNLRIYDIPKEVKDAFWHNIDTKKQNWNTDVRNFIKSNTDFYDIISYQNVHGYILEDRDAVIPGLLDRLNSGGIFITDPTLKIPENLVQYYDLENLRPGIYKKRTADLNRGFRNILKRHSSTNGSSEQ